MDKNKIYSFIIGLFVFILGGLYIVSINQPDILNDTTPPAVDTTPEENDDAEETKKIGNYNEFETYPYTVNDLGFLYYQNFRSDYINSDGNLTNIIAKPDDFELTAKNRIDSVIYIEEESLLVITDTLGYEYNFYINYVLNYDLEIVKIE